MPNARHLTDNLREAVSGVRLGTPLAHGRCPRCSIPIVTVPMEALGRYVRLAPLTRLVQRLGWLKRVEYHHCRQCMGLYSTVGWGVGRFYSERSRYEAHISNEQWKEMLATCQPSRG